VFLDYDGTISTVDTGLHLMERLADGSWNEIEHLFEHKLIGSRECMVREWALLPTTDEHLLRSVAGEVSIDPDLGLLVDHLHGAGAEVTVVSDGFGFYVWAVGGAVGVPVMTAQVDWPAGTLVFPYRDLGCPCGNCGTCKQAPVRDAKSRGRTTIFVGDGTSDRMVAPLVDTLYAKDGLARWCDGNRVSYRGFSTLRDVASDLGLLSGDEA
jgi:2-hydroxy-3-keto-5-methylthiopentenyl-1-phosphate phosphatase